MLHVSNKQRRAALCPGVLSDSGKLDAAIVAFGEALRRDPVLIEVRMTRLHQYLSVRCDL